MVKIRGRILALSFAKKARESTLRLPTRAICLTAVIVLAAGAALGEDTPSQDASSTEPFGIALEGFPYPYPVNLFPLTQEGEQFHMAYMDVAPKAGANGRTVLLLHGRNFPSSYWQATIDALTGAGYRVVAPDQIGFNKSSKPTFDLHFDQLARNTAALLDGLHIDKVSVIGHSTGGMLSVRFARMYPERVDKIVLDGPIGLEDYRIHVPPIPAERLMELEDKVTAESYQAQLLNVYALKLSAEQIAPYVASRTRVKGSAEYPRWLRAFVNSAQMIWREPVVYEIPLLPQDVLFVIGENDRLAPGRDFAPKEVRDEMGRNAQNARALGAKMKQARVEVFEGIGHLPHLEAPERFNDLVLEFLGESE
jgi:pimeloyl-ACP methyl ester carboxylesterase